MDQNTTAQNIITHVSAATSYCLLFSVNYAPTPSEEKEKSSSGPLNMIPFQPAKCFLAQSNTSKAETHRKQAAGLTHHLSLVSSVGSSLISF